MDLMQAKRELYSTSFFFPRTRQRRAVKYLADSADVASVDVLAEALVKGHQESRTIHDILTGLGPRGEQPKIDRLWRMWLDGRSDRLANVLREMGRPARDLELRLQSHWKLGRAEPVDPNPTAVRGALSWLNDADAQIRDQALRAISGLPNDPVINDEIVDFWLKHPSADIQRIITEQRRSPTQEKIDQLWRAWLKERSATLEPVVLELGIPAAEQSTSVPSKWKLGVEVRLRADQGTVRRVLRWIKDKDTAIRGGLLKTLRQLPDDEQLNNEIFQAWLEHQSGELEELIKVQGRKPADTKLEALFYLVTGQPKLYQALRDESGEYFQQAFLMAPAAYRQRINETVVKSGQSQLVAIYGRAMAGHETFDRRLYLDALKTAGDEDRLFESLREMKLFECLDLCKRWAEEDRLPTDARRRQAAEDAVRAYQGLGEMVFEEGPAPPAGLRDLFAVWKQASSGRDQRGQDLKAKDPLVRAKAIFLEHAKGAVNDRQLSEASKSDDWPVRLMARLSNPVLAAADDHVEWIGALSGGDAELLQAPILGTPVDYARYSERLAKARTRGAPAHRDIRLLEILCAFQGAFVSGGITVVDSDEATDRGAVVVEDAMEDAPLDGF